MNENTIESNVNHTGNNDRRPVKPARFGKTLIVACIVIAVAALAVTAAVAAFVVASPAALLVQGAKNSAQALEENPVIQLMADVVDGGSAELELELDELLDMILDFGDLGLNGSVSLKLYNDVADQKTAAVAKVDIGEKEFADASIMLSGYDLIVTSASLLEGNAYGIDLEHAEEYFPTSVFGPDGYLALGIDSIEGTAEYINNRAILKKKAEALAEEFSAVLLTSLRKHAEMTKGSGELLFSGENTRVSVVTITLDREDFLAVVADMITYLREDEQARELFEAYADEAELKMKADYVSDRAYYEMNYGLTSYEEYRSYFYGDTFDPVDEVYAVLDEVEAELETFDEFDKVTAQFYITKLRKELVGADLCIEAEEDLSTFELRAGPAMKDLREISLHMTGAYDDVTVLYEVEVNDKTEYVACLSVRDDDFEVLSCEIEWDRQDGDFEIALVENGGRYFVESTLEVSEEGAVFDLNTIGRNSVMLELDAVLTLKTDDKMPEIPQKYVDIMKLTNEDLEEMAADVAAQLLSKIYTLDSSLVWLLGMLLGF